MKELISKFLSLLRYVPYIIDENPKIQRFLSCFPISFKDIIEFDNPKTLNRQWEKITFVTNKVKIRENAYLIGKIKEQVTLSREGNVLSLIKALEIISEISVGLKAFSSVFQIICSFNLPVTYTFSFISSLFIIEISLPHCFLKVFWIVVFNYVLKDKR